MTVDQATAVTPIAHPDRFFIDGQWVQPSTDATFDVIDAATEQLYFRAAEAQAPTCRGRSTPPGGRSTTARGRD